MKEDGMDGVCSRHEECKNSLEDFGRKSSTGDTFFQEAGEDGKILTNRRSI
jgi:hypothetical protein